MVGRIGEQQRRHWQGGARERESDGCGIGAGKGDGTGARTMEAARLQVGGDTGVEVDPVTTDDGQGAIATTPDPSILSRTSRVGC
jgi:hypothetical protein